MSSRPSPTPVANQQQAGGLNGFCTAYDSRIPPCPYSSRRCCAKCAALLPQLRQGARHLLRALAASFFRVLLLPMRCAFRMADDSCSLATCTCGSRAAAAALKRLPCRAWWACWRSCTTSCITHLRICARVGLHPACGRDDLAGRRPASGWSMSCCQCDCWERSVARVVRCSYLDTYIADMSGSLRRPVFFRGHLEAGENDCLHGPHRTWGAPGASPRSQGSRHDASGGSISQGSHEADRGLTPGYPQRCVPLFQSASPTGGCEHSPAAAKRSSTMTLGVAART